MAIQTYFHAGDLLRNIRTGDVLRVSGFGTLWPTGDHRLWDDWGWIEHSLEAHAALEHFARQVPTITVTWNEDDFIPRAQKHKNAITTVLKWGRR